MGNTYSIPPFSIPCLGTKSLAASSCRFNQSFLKMKLFFENVVATCPAKIVTVEME